MPVQVSKYSLTQIVGEGVGWQCRGVLKILEAERHSLVAFMMRGGGKCAVGYISRSLHWSNSLSLSCGDQLVSFHGHH